jgi:M6 family metalloprotease-like protein
MKRLITVLLIICTLIIFTACNTLEGIKKDLGFSTDDKIENSNDNQDGDEIPDNNENPDNNNQDNGNTNNNAETKTKADEWRKTYNCITVKEAIEICASTGSTETEKQYYVIVEIVEITDSFYGNMTVKDSTGRITVYSSYGADGEKRYGELGTTAPKVGDVVLFYTNLVNYGNIQPEMHNSRIIDFYTPGDDNSGNTGTGSGDSDSGNTGTGSGDSNSGNTGSGSTSTTHTYNDFTSAEKSTMTNIIGEVLPFAPNDEYYLDDYDDAVEFYTFDLTEADFSAYRLKFSSYTYEGSETDEEYSDIIWHIYTKGDLVVELSLYYNEDEDYGTYSVLHVYAYLDTNTDSGNTGTGSGTGSGNTSTDLPTGVDGVYNVDFTDATNVKDVTDQGYYLGGCPTTGSPAVLVIPVQFTDKLAASSHNLDKLENAFTKIDPNDGFYSVYEYYYISSYEQLTLDITVLDYWFTPSRNSSYYENSKDSEGYNNGDMLIMDEAIAYLATIMDLSKFDSDNNGFIDAIILVNTLDIDSDSDFNWAYRYWNYHTDSQGDYYEYDGVSANDYIWASFNFLFESYDSNDNPIYTDTSVMNTYTFIHEFAHVLGVDDYYNYNGDVHPMDGCDVMDIMFGDHNPYSKFNLGWIKTSRLVVTDTSISLTLEDFSKSGDTIIIANDWDEDLGAYQEYYVLMYYKGTGLNDIDAGYGYFSRDGVVVYHVNATLYTETIDGETYYDVANNNNSPADDGSGSEDNLIEFVKSSADTFTYIEGDTLPAVTDDDGDTLAYTFTVDSITDSYATITFTAK